MPLEVKDLYGFGRFVQSLAAPLRNGTGEGGSPMLQSIRKHAAVPHVPVKLALSAGALASFGVLLAHDQIHPIVLYALQLYLSF
jgi:hypothetical protein